MNHHKFLLSAPYDDVDVETEGPTFAIAIGQALPNLSRRLGNSRTILGVRPFQDGRKDFYGFELDVDPDEVTPDLLINRYGARQPVPAPSDLDRLEIEAYDVYETMDSIEGLLRYAAQDLIDDESRHGLIRARALEYRQAVSDVLVYDPKAKIDIVESLARLFDGMDQTAARAFQTDAVHRLAEQLTVFGLGDDVAFGGDHLDTEFFQNSGIG